MTSISVRPYVYDTLKSKSFIRVLHLYPGKGDEPLKGKFELANVEICSIVIYKALSYVWGDPSKHGVIDLGGGQLGLTHNLEVALRRLRHGSDVVVLWADGVCINQNDFNERGHQVKLMGKIYSQAAQVIAWLGPDPFDRADRIARTLCLQSSHFPMAEKFKALSDLLECEWFGRLWVVQEVTLARAAIFLWGQHTIPYRGVHEVARHYNRVLEHDPVWVGQLKSNSFDVLDVIQALAWTKDLKCSDNRDRLYAVLGLPYLDKLQIEAIEPNYGKPVQEIFYELALGLVQNGFLSRLWTSIYHDTDWNPFINDLPTWASDMAQAPYLYHSKFRSLGSLPKVPTPKAIINCSDRSLKLQGWILGSVSFVTHDSMDCKSVQRKLEYVAAFWKAHIRKAGLEDDYETFEFARMLFSFSLQNLSFIYYFDREDALTAQIYIFDERYNGHAPLSEMLTTFRESFDPPRSDINWDFMGEDRLLDSYWRYHKLFLTSNGHSGLGPIMIKPGDLVVVIPGCEFPAILRPYKDWYFFIGNASVSGIQEWPTSETLGKKDEDLQSFTVR